MRRVFWILLFIGFVFKVEATHNRAGEIIYCHLYDLTYEVTIITYTKCSSTSADRDSLELIWYSADSSVEIGRKTVARFPAPITLPDDVCYNTYTTTISFPGRASYVLTMTDPNRIGDIINISGSIGVKFYLEDTIHIPNELKLGNNCSVELFTPPIDYACVGDTFIHNPGAYDPDGDSLVFTLIPPKQEPNLDVPGYLFPDEVNPGPDNTIALDRNTGEFIWATPQRVGIYNIAFLVQEYRSGQLISSMIRDMQIFVDNCPNNDPPKLDPIVDTCIYAGDTLDITIRATDSDFGQTVTLYAYGGPLEISSDPASFTAISGNPALGSFYWQTNCDHVRSQFYTVIFKAEDDFIKPSGARVPLTDIETWTINVIAPPPENLVVTTTGRVANLSWDNPYICEGSDKFRGFSVWRKIGCDTSDIGICETDLSSFGYVRLVSGLTTYSYADSTLSPGNKYTYRVQADFSEKTAAGFDYDAFVGGPSNPVCVELNRDLPLLTHVTVDSTDLADGIITIAWIKPDPAALDTGIYTAPYRYELINLNTGGTVADITTPTFSTGGDSLGVAETGLNTQETQYAYQLNFYAELSGSEILVGETVSASSVFLSLIGRDNEMNLSWTASVPWLNYRYVIFKEIPLASGNFVALDTTYIPSYKDDSLTNGTTYCYYIEALGGYSSVGTPDSMYNLSQIACDDPYDSTRPCAPILSVTNICDEDTDAGLDPTLLQNNLVWTNPNNRCPGTSDVIAYEVLFTPETGGEFTVLVTLGDMNDTFYFHNNITSLAGCYAVRAIDSSGNRSVFSNVVCVDNCPDYVLPNVFTPNNDGQNDLFTPFLPFHFIDRVDFKAYNRWGGLVFETSDPMLNWDGTGLNGQELAEGVYFYVCDVYEITVNGVLPSKQVLSGYIHLIRGE